MAQMSVQVPGDLNNVATAVQTLASGLLSGQGVIQAISAVVPTLFSEASNLDELKKEIKDPANLAWAGLMLGTLAAAYGPMLIAKIKARKSSSAAPVSSGSVAVSAPSA
jgi:hypothetical protein